MIIAYLNINTTLVTFSLSPWKKIPVDGCQCRSLEQCSICYSVTHPIITVTGCRNSGQISVFLSLSWHGLIGCLINTQCLIHVMVCYLYLQLLILFICPLQNLLIWNKIVKHKRIAFCLLIPLIQKEPSSVSEEGHSQCAKIKSIGKRNTIRSFPY